MAKTWSVIPDELDAVTLYSAEGVLSEEEAARHDEPAEAAELARLTAILDGDYIPEQKRHVGVVLMAASCAPHARHFAADQPAGGGRGRDHRPGSGGRGRRRGGRGAGRRPEASASVGRTTSARC